ncbi:MAG: beta-glucosidase [Clostridiaceae bacterium]|nr:beta-glucosidase [Clostridiaceae bacterium]
MFKKDFFWGTATASYQIEGAFNQDGRGLSVWDVFSRWPGKVRDGHNGDIACDHYNRYKEDVKLMKELGINAYRFSVSWSRVLPDGIGKVNEKGLDFYDRLVDELLKNNITPFMTLFHWDYPYELYRKGGWLNPDSPKWFLEYTKVLCDRLSDRVQYYMTLNEPQCFIGVGHKWGGHAPGLRLSDYDLLYAVHNTLLAHGESVKYIRENAKTKPHIGFAPCGIVAIPSTGNDVDAARRYMFDNSDIGRNAVWMDPVYLGKYPKEFGEQVGNLPKIDLDADLKTISQPLDFFGCNTYHGEIVTTDSSGNVITLRKPVGNTRTAINWHVTPEVLYWGPKLFYERYQKPVIMTENGMANCDTISFDGKCHDPQRIDYVHRHLLSLKKAAEEGVEVDGYFLWSLLDNFEWAEGYNERFGIIYVDYQTQKRTPKDSYYWYKSVIEANGENL